MSSTSRTNFAINELLRHIYEDQQSFSPTFNSFSGKLAASLIDRYQIFDKDVLEIGCSKGDFLALMCE